MNETQKAIKYCAIAFAIFLIVAIISGITFGIYGIFTLGDTLISNRDVKEKCESAEEYCLQITLAASNLSIKTGDAFKVDTKNDKIEVKNDGNRLIIVEKGRHLFDSYNDRDVTLYLPADTTYEKAYLEGGAGNIYIETLMVKDLEMSLGVGSSEINNLVAKKAKISTGIGDTKINNLDIEDAKISAGIGEVSVNLAQKAEEYSIEVSKGLGSVTLNGTTIPDDGKAGNGDRDLDISGGIGAVKITTED